MIQAYSLKTKITTIHGDWDVEVTNDRNRNELVDDDDLGALVED